MRGFGRLIDVCNYALSRFESRFSVNNRLLITWKQLSFRNHVTRRVLQSIIFSLSRLAVNATTFRVHMLQ